MLKTQEGGDEGEKKSLTYYYSIVVLRVLIVADLKYPIYTYIHSTLLYCTVER